MKLKLLLFFGCLSHGFLLSQPSSSNDFEDGTTQNWEIGSNGTTGVVNISTGGPLGANDNYITYTSLGSGTDESRMVIFNQSSDWMGNYTSPSVKVAIVFDARAGNENLNLRVAIDGAGGRFCSTNSFTVNAGAGWTAVTIDILPSDFTAVGGSNVNSTLSSLSTVRILSSTAPAWRGDRISATLDLDNVDAVETLSLKNEINSSNFTISPNPGMDRLNLSISGTQLNSSVEVYDVLGKRVLAQKLTNFKPSINISQWNKGVYLVRVVSDNGPQTKRFIKQ